MKKGIVYYRDQVAGSLERDASGFVFSYDPAYLANSSLPDISATLPKRTDAYRSPYLFSFFYGLLAEGAQKDMPRAEDRRARPFHAPVGNECLRRHWSGLC